MESGNAGRDIEPAEHLDHVCQRAFTGLDAKETAVESKFPVIPCVLLLFKVSCADSEQGSICTEKVATKFGLR